MADYGSFPGVKISTTGGSLTGVQVGDEEYLVIFGPGGSGATANPNDPTGVNSLSETDTKFGTDSPLAFAMRQALDHDANREYLRGVITERKSVSAEDVGTAASHTGGAKISNVPLHEDEATITFTGATVGDLAVEFRYETNTDSTTTDFSSLTPPTATVYINPLTGEWVADASDDYSISYDYYDYQSAFDSADLVLNESETGVYAALTESTDVVSALSTKVTTLRKNYQMVQGVAGALPNKTNSKGKPGYTPADYSDTIDDDAIYLVAPIRHAGYQAAQPATLIGSVGGLMAGHSITEPVYNDTISNGGNLGQRFTKSDADKLRAAQVIPLRQSGSIRIRSNASTSTATDWERDFWRRRIADRVVLLGKEIGDATIGRINDEDTRGKAETLLWGHLSEMVSDRLLKPNTPDERRWYVEITENATNSDTVDVDIGFTPQGVVKRIDTTVTINT